MLIFNFLGAKVTYCFELAITLIIIKDEHWGLKDELKNKAPAFRPARGY